MRKETRAKSPTINKHNIESRGPQLQAKAGEAQKKSRKNQQASKHYYPQHYESLAFLGGNTIKSNFNREKKQIWMNGAILGHNCSSQIRTSSLSNNKRKHIKSSGRQENSKKSQKKYIKEQERLSGKKYLESKRAIDKNEKYLKKTEFMLVVTQLKNAMTKIHTSMEKMQASIGKFHEQMILSMQASNQTSKQTNALIKQMCQNSVSQEYEQDEESEKINPNLPSIKEVTEKSNDNEQMSYPELRNYPQLLKLKVKMESSPEQEKQKPNYFDDIPIQ